MMGGLNGGDIKGTLSGPQGADIMSAASALMSGGKVDDSNPLAAMLNGPQGLIFGSGPVYNDGL
jgi:hypothetical protein